MLDIEEVKIRLDYLEQRQESLEESLRHLIDAMRQASDQLEKLQLKFNELKKRE